MRMLRNLIIILLVLIVGLVFAKNIIIQAAMVNGVKAISGVGVEVRGVDAGLIKSYLSLKGLKLLNPAGFKDKMMADFPEIYVSYALGDILKGKIHLPDIRIDLKELTVIKNEENKVNVKSLEAFAPKQGGGKPPAIQIDNLNLKIGKVIYKDYQGGKENVREFNVNIDENFKNITDPQALGKLILVKALSKTSIANLANIDLSNIKQQISETAVQQLEQKAASTLQSFFK